MAALPRALEKLPLEGGLADLLSRAALGDERAWISIVERYSRRVYAVAKSHCGKPELAEEITQSVFVTIAQKLKGGAYHEEGRFESWLFRVAMNRIRDEVRRMRRHAVPVDPESLGAMAAPEPRTGDDRVGALRSAVSELSDADREVILLRHHAELSFNQISELLEEPLGTLLARHHRALKKLKAMMEGEP